MQRDITSTDILDPNLLQSVVRQATFQCRAEGSGFYLCDPERGHKTLLATQNLPKEPWDEFLLKEVIDSGQAVIKTLPDQSALMAAPLIWQEAVRGLLIVFDSQPGRTFRNRDVALIQSLADLTASVAQQNERLARMTTQFRALHTIDVALTSSLDLDHVLNLILEKAAELVGAEHGSLRHLEPETGNLVLKAHYGEGWTTEKLAYTPRIGQGIARWVAEKQRPYLSPDVRKDPLNVVLFEDMRSSISVPLLYSSDTEQKKGKLIGVLLLESSRLAAFDQQDVELLEALAQEAVIAIQNATQLQKLKAEQERRLAAEKWAVMGQAATALAHRINNLLGIVPVSAKEVLRILAELDLSEADRRWTQSNLERIHRNAQFILKLSEALFRPFKESGPPARFDVNRLLNEALASADLSDDIEIACHYDKQLPPVNCSLLLLDIFLELIANACKAMENQTRRRLEISSRSEQINGLPWVMVKISDTGKGIKSQNLDHLWDLFQPSDDGLGFGLWWMRTFIERQGGTIECHSQPDKGSTFIVRLPAFIGGRHKTEDRGQNTEDRNQKSENRKQKTGY
ncbi:MAG: GAF domain-containing protein [Desulfobacterales bacterium]|jgi:signal transduction histidine kinase